jgi:DNA-binding transcriptional LysR family regulator
MIDLDLDQLRLLLLITESRSLTEAARRLDRSPATLSYQLARIERSLGQALFSRAHRRLTPTAFGAIAVAEARTVLAIAESRFERLQTLSQGGQYRIRMAVSDLILPERIIELIDRLSPDQRPPEILWTTEVLRGLWDALQTGRADLALGVALPGHPAEGIFRLEPIGDVQFHFVMRPNHPLALEPEPLDPEKIRRERTVAAIDSSRVLSPGHFGILPGQDLLRVPDQAAKRLAILAGLGVGHLPEHLIREDLASGRLLTRRTTQSPTGPTPLYLAWRESDPLDPHGILARLLQEIRAKSREPFWFS